MTHGRDGYGVTVRRVPAWARAVSLLAQHLPCLCGWGWTWRVGWGRDPDDGSEPRWSLASGSDRVISWLLLLEDRHGTEVVRFPLTIAVARQIAPDFVAEIDSWSDYADVEPGPS